jgi:glycine cleavage system H protein
MAEANYPEDLLYHSEHDWARIDGDQATLGITWYAQDALGEVVFFEAPALGTMLAKGEIIAVNDSLGENSETINEDPYGEGWLVKIRLSDPSEREALMDRETYTASLAG